jgi:hypothetical protein
MATALPLRAALKRGALVTAANWPVVLVDFTIESLYKFALAVPVVGGALLVAVLAGDDVRAIVSEGVRAAADLVLSALGTAPLALAGFLAAISIVAVGGAIVMFGVKAGTLATIVAGEQTDDDLHRGPLRMDALRRAYAYEAGSVLAAVRRFARRAALLTVWLSLAYALIGSAWVVAVRGAIELASTTAWQSIWPLLVLLATSGALIAVTAVNLCYDLLRIIVIAEDCRLSAAVRRLREFLGQDTRQVLGIWSVVVVLLLMALAVSILVAAGLTFVAWVPIIGLIGVPLQLAGWLVRGLVFQYVSISALASYQAQYRRFRQPEALPAAPARLIQPA